MEHRCVQANNNENRIKATNFCPIVLDLVYFFFLSSFFFVPVVLKTFQTLITNCFVYSYLLKVTNWMQCVHFNCGAQLRRLLDYSALDALSSVLALSVIVVLVAHCLSSFRFFQMHRTDLIYVVVVFSYYCYCWCCCCWSFRLLLLLLAYYFTPDLNSQHWIWVACKCVCARQPATCTSPRFICRFVCARVCVFVCNWCWLLLLFTIYLMCFIFRCCCYFCSTSCKRPTAKKNEMRWQDKQASKKMGKIIEEKRINYLYFLFCI